MMALEYFLKYLTFLCLRKDNIMENSYQYHLVYNLIFTQSSINFKFLYESIKLLLLDFMLMSIF